MLHQQARVLLQLEKFQDFYERQERVVRRLRGSQLLGPGSLEEVLFSAFGQVLGSLDGGLGVFNDGLMELLPLFLLPFLHGLILVIFI